MSAGALLQKARLVMFRSWRLGKLFNIPIFVHPTFLLVPAIVLLNNPGGPVNAILGVVFILCVFGCVLLHEYGHALMARYFGIGTTDITLYPIGGVARLRKMGDNPQQELLIALAGPAVNLAIVLLLAPLVVLAILFGGALGSHFLVGAGSISMVAILGQFVVLLACANAGLMVFNLLPIFPMDGGRVLRALLSMGLGQLRATEIAAALSMVLAAVTVFLVLFGPFSNPMLLVVAVFVVFAGQQELFMIRQHARAAGLRPVNEPLAVVAEQAPYSDDAPAFQPSYLPREPGFSGFTWDRQYHVWVKWVDGQPVATLGPTR